MKNIVKCVIGIIVGIFCSSVEASVLLTATNEALELQTSAAVSTDYKCEFADHTTTTFVPGTSQGNIVSATTTTIVSAPAASTQRQIKECRIYNRSTTTAQTITFKFDVGGTERFLYVATLAAEESVQYTESLGFSIFTRTGLIRTLNTDINGYSGNSYAIQKTGTAKDAAGYWYAHAKDAGFPGAFNVGAPGLNGFNTDCSVASNATNPIGAAQVGSDRLVDAASGSYYITEASFNSSVAELKQFVDPLWINTGAVVTTTTAQTITMPGALPARDIYGTTNGDGVYAALLTTTANTNAAVITNTTISYTNSDGIAGRTGTFSAIVGWQAPATPVIGTWMPFQLAAGDRGIRSVQSITLGTSYGAGALSLVLYRPLFNISVTSANLSVPLGPVAPPGIRIYNDTCVWSIEVGSATAATIAGSYSIMER